MTKNKKAVISNESLVADLEQKLESISPETKTIIEQAINRIKNIGKYVSRVLERQTTLTIEPTPELVVNKKNLHQSIEKVTEREKKHGNKKDVVFIDDNFLLDDNALKGQIMPAIEKSFEAKIHRLIKNCTDLQINEEVEKLSVKKDWSITEAWNIIIASILAGEVDVKGKGIFVYFTIQVKNKDIPYLFYALRNNKNSLRLLVFKVNETNETGQTFKWNKDNGVVLSN